MTHRTPFHRRVLFWVFIIMFCAVSPAAIFYTAGYRWNPKKGAIERNGTLIIDTTPEGAKIALNGSDLKELSPVTQRDVAPGAYRIRLELAGYHSWEKTLNVQPERVTFVNDILLWSKAEPQLTETVEARAVAVSANGRYLASVRKQNGTFGVTIADTQNGRTTEFDLATSTFVGNGSLAWNGNASALFIKDEAEHAWVVSRTGARAVSLPLESYRWSGSDLVGASVDGGRETYDPATGSAARTVLADGVIDIEGAYELVRVASSSAYALRDHSEKERLYTLPVGAWHFVSASDDFVFLRSDDLLLAFRHGSSLAAPDALPSSEPPVPLKIGNAESLLSVYENEIWMAAPNTDPILLVRKSVPIVGVAWHRLGRDLFYVTPTNVVALNLDPRDGRIETVLGEFDEIFGFAVERTQLVISARRGEVRGLWTIQVE